MRGALQRGPPPRLLLRPPTGPAHPPARRPVHRAAFTAARGKLAPRWRAVATWPRPGTHCGGQGSGAAPQETVPGGQPSCRGTWSCGHGEEPVSATDPGEARDPPAGPSEHPGAVSGGPEAPGRRGGRTPGSRPRAPCASRPASRGLREASSYPISLSVLRLPTAPLFYTPACKWDRAQSPSDHLRLGRISGKGKVWPGGGLRSSAVPWNRNWEPGVCARNR